MFLERAKGRVPFHRGRRESLGSREGARVYPPFPRAPKKESASPAERRYGNVAVKLVFIGGQFANTFPTRVDARLGFPHTCSRVYGENIRTTYVATPSRSQIMRGCGYAGRIKGQRVSCESVGSILWHSSLLHYSLSVSIQILRKTIRCSCFFLSQAWCVSG